jgi:surface polysaccharide O-acyltransferase-like enzyme
VVLGDPTEEETEKVSALWHSSLFNANIDTQRLVFVTVVFFFFFRLTPKVNFIITLPCNGGFYRYLFYFILGIFIAHYPRVSSKRFTFTLTLLAVLPE